MADEVKFATGLYYFEPHQNAPDFVLGTISIKPKEFVDWLRENHKAVDDQGYLKLAVKRAKSGKPYVSIDTYKPKPKEDWASPQSGGGWDEESVPF